MTTQLRVPLTVAQATEVGWGWTMADVDRCAGVAVHTARTGPLSFDDRYEAAWHGIVVFLLETVDEAPFWMEMRRAGENAIQREIDLHAQLYGWRAETDDERPAFATYWREPGHPSLSDRIIERVAAVQVLDALDDDEYELIVALAAYGNVDEAAYFLRLEKPEFQARLRKARERAIAVWFSPEHPAAKPDPAVYCKRWHLRETYTYRKNNGHMQCRKCKQIENRKRHNEKTPLLVLKSLGLDENGDAA